MDTEAIPHLMQHFSAQHLLFVCEARERITFDAQPGKALRGAIYHALIRDFSPKEPIPGLPLDPVRSLLEDKDEAYVRGEDLPRGFAIEPPPPYTRVQAGERFEFGVSLLGVAADLLPYLMRGARAAGSLGLGPGRGQFSLVRIDEFNPLNDSRRVVMHHRRVVPPRLQVTHKRIEEEVGMRQAEHVTLHFLSPMRLIQDGRLVHTPRMGVILRRLVERAQTLVEYQSSDLDHIASPERWKTEYDQMAALGDVMDETGLLYDRTHWVNVSSHSQAKQRSTPIGGIVGEARWRIDSTAVWTWLLWGQSLHVGKNAVKGDGYFRVE